MNSEKKITTYVTKIEINLADKLVSDLSEMGFVIKKPQYTLFSAAKKHLNCILYESGKLVVQGKDTAEFVQFYLEPNVLGKFTFGYEELEIDQTARIGIDEAGKGDFFGPLCIAGVFASGEDILKLKKMGVKDSKGMSDKTIKIIGNKIKKEFSYHVIKINPLKYNELYDKFRNLNHLLAWGHATAIEELIKKTGCKNVIIDQFAAEHVVASALKKKGVTVNLTQRHRAEEDLVVAAASIIARLAFLDGLDQVGQPYSFKLPKGASDIVIKAGVKFVSINGSDALKTIAKLHFKTLDAILKNVQK